MNKVTYFVLAESSIYSLRCSFKYFLSNFYIFVNTEMPIAEQLTVYCTLYITKYICTYSVLYMYRACSCRYQYCRHIFVYVTG